MGFVIGVVVVRGEDGGDEAALMEDARPLRVRRRENELGEDGRAVGERRGDKGGEDDTAPRIGEQVDEEAAVLVSDEVDKVAVELEVEMRTVPARAAATDETQGTYNTPGSCLQ